LPDVCAGEVVVVRVLTEMDVGEKDELMTRSLGEIYDGEPQERKQTALVGQLL